MVHVGVIGCGYWGPNHVRIFSQLPNSRVISVADTDEGRLEAVKSLYPSVSVTQEYSEILQNPQIDAICVATSTDSHYKITKDALNAGKHVLCEKPLSLQFEECEELGELARAKGRILMVGHVFLFNAGIVKLKEHIQSGELGKIYYAYSTRTNLGPFRYDVNALWDLAPHDISIFNYLLDATALNVSARGQKSLGTNQEDLAFATLEYPGNIIVNIHVSWLDPKKVRQITLVGDKKMIVWDDLDNMGPIKLYDKHVERTQTYYHTYGEFKLLSQEGSITIPKVGSKEPLKTQNEYFIDCVEHDAPPDLADATRAGDVVKTLKAVQESMDLHGSQVKVS